MRVRFLPAAEAEFLEFIAQYEGERAGLGRAFLAETERILERIATFPEHGSPFVAGTRHIVLARFPFHVIYELHEDEALVIAVAHQQRHPAYWRDRPRA
jgi:plasmid stabilization system protein ParE